jgi:hypothetical protein
MFKRIAVMMLATLGLNALAADDGKVKTLLKQADEYRLALDSGRVETEVRSFKAGALDKTRLYAVYLKPGHRSLVLFRTASERGQKMLMLGDDYWLMMPSSQRPLRITPMQKLLGEASTGDIATMTWGEDYDGTISGEETHRRRALPQAGPDRPAQGRELSAHRALPVEEGPPPGAG